MRRYLNVGDHTFMMDDNDAEALVEDGVLYPCKEGDPESEHDLHLNPTFKFDLLSVEAILKSIHHK